MTGKPVPIMNGTEFGGSRSTLTDAQRQEAVAMVEAGLERAEVARRIGVSPSTVSRIAAAAGLGFAGSSKTQAAVQARVLQLRERRVDAAEHLHVTLEQSLALAALTMLQTPTDSRGIADRARAVRDLAAAYESLAKIDARTLDDFATEAAKEWLDAALGSIGIREIPGETEEGATDAQH